MRHSLLLLGVIAALAIGAPAYSQYIYYDSNADGVCTATDVLTSSSTAVDVWINTNHNANGSVASCSAGTPQPLDMFSYSIIFHSSGSGSLTMNTWTNAASGFQQINPLTKAGADGGVDFAAPVGGNLSPGLYKLGTLGITVTGSPVLSFLHDNSSNAGIPTPVTGFGSTCDGTAYLNTIVLQTDFFDNCPTKSTTPVESTTWGKIKQLYR